jgi:two-component system, NtrC family, C4-dicarboxylate transport response regulator DctD
MAVFMIHILVIDDDRHMSRACERVLTNAGATVACAGTGLEGVKVLSESLGKISAILMDRMMPGELSGAGLISRIHALDPAIPVILVSGASMQIIQAEADRIGAVGCLAKPFTPDQLCEAIKTALKIETFE